METKAEISSLIELAEKAGRGAERAACWEEINAYIKTGDLPEPAHSERNGLVLACNIISGGVDEFVENIRKLKQRQE